MPKTLTKRAALKALVEAIAHERYAEKSLHHESEFMAPESRGTSYNLKLRLYREAQKARRDAEINLLRSRG